MSSRFLQTLLKTLFLCCVLSGFICGLFVYREIVEFQKVSTATTYSGRGPCTQETEHCPWKRWKWTGAFDENFQPPACCRAHLHEMVGFLTSLLSAHNISYWADFGTLLGIMREKEYISWDTDADFGFHFQDYDKIKTLFEENLSHRGYSLRIREKEVYCKGTCFTVYYSELNKIHVDFDGWKSEHLNGREHLVVSPNPEEPIHQADHILPPKPCQLRDIPLLCPIQSERVLHKNYGPDWRLPKACKTGECSWYQKWDEFKDHFLQRPF